jgi:hypothetical protein
MARGGALIQPGSVYHLISRFVAKDWFIESAVERRMYLALLGIAISVTDWRLFSYAVMSSHIHLAAVAGSVPLRDWLQPMHTRFANWLNVRRLRIGAVFVRGPNVLDVRPDDVARTISYIHANPVRAQVVSQTSQSDWTSQRAYEGTAYRQTWLDVDCGTKLAGFESPEALAEWCSTSEHRDAMTKAGRGRPRAA